MMKISPCDNQDTVVPHCIKKQFARFNQKSFSFPFLQQVVQDVSFFLNRTRRAAEAWTLFYADLWGLIGDIMSTGQIDGSFFGLLLLQLISIKVQLEEVSSPSSSHLVLL